MIATCFAIKQTDDIHMYTQRLINQGKYEQKKINSLNEKQFDFLEHEINKILKTYF